MHHWLYGIDQATHTVLYFLYKQCWWVKLLGWVVYSVLVYQPNYRRLEPNYPLTGSDMCAWLCAAVRASCWHCDLVNFYRVYPSLRTIHMNLSQRCIPQKHTHLRTVLANSYWYTYMHSLHTYTRTPTHGPNEALIHIHTMETLSRHLQNSPHTLETHTHALGSSRKQTEGSRRDLLASVSTLLLPPPPVCLPACLPVWLPSYVASYPTSPQCFSFVSGRAGDVRERRVSVSADWLTILNTAKTNDIVYDHNDYI